MGRFVIIADAARNDVGFNGKTGDTHLIFGAEKPFGSKAAAEKVLATWRKLSSFTNYRVALLNEQYVAHPGRRTGKNNDDQQYFPC